MYHKRVRWLIDNLERVRGLSSYTVSDLMIKEGLYSPKSVKRDISMTIESMLDYIKKLG